MLSECPIHAALPTTDLERAKRFYTDKLGLLPESEGPDGLFYRCGGATRFLAFPSGGSASRTHTQMTWNIPNIEAEVAELKAHGVVFEEYDLPSDRFLVPGRMAALARLVRIRGQSASGSCR